MAAPYDAQREMLQQLQDMKRKVEAGEICSLMICARRVDEGGHIWLTKMPSSHLAYLFALVQARLVHTFKDLREPE